MDSTGKVSHGLNWQLLSGLSLADIGLLVVCFAGLDAATAGAQTLLYSVGGRLCLVGLVLVWIGTSNLSAAAWPRVATNLAGYRTLPIGRRRRSHKSSRTVTSSFWEQVRRGAYPIEFIKNSKVPCVAGHPTDIIFLTCDAFGVLPPVAKLSPDEAMYHFISGYTAKVAGTEVGVTEPQATFSACFGAPFLVWHPAKYAELLASKMKQQGVNVWLVNTGWSGGSYGQGSRIKLKYTRAIIDAIHAGVLTSARTRKDSTFGFEVVTECPNVPQEILLPEETWDDPAAYRATARKLTTLFVKNFALYESGVANRLGFLDQSLNK